MIRRQILGLIGGGVAALALVGCGSAKHDSSDKGVVFATQKNGVPFLAQARGEFEKRLKARGIGPVKWVEFPSGPPLIEAIRAGAVDIGLVGDTPVVYAQAAGTDLYYVAAQSVPGLVGSGLVVPKGSTVKSFADLKGKKVAYTKGSASEYAIASALGRVGLTLADIVSVNLAPGDAQTALANGSIDAWLTWDPYFTLALARSNAREIALPPSDLRTVALYVASGKFTRDRTDVLKVTLDELRAEAAWGNAHRTFYRDAVAKATRLPLPVLDGMLARYKDFLFAVDPITPADIATQQRVADYLLAAKVIPRKIDAAKAAWTGWTPAK
ncbi:aliphatic sulfonate ABC transporter substrate-binding protein [Sphingomonas sp. TF3]|uniref:aliphatic sulfonate ABC transporter substrate-binding protein n=1 Tax=Sphingomonas sp. TF3 TaxID=2495580 RepID=UPI000F8894B5|nr:aliphatic sulfonate ABC transporter substrate-binding protein [Sphingomonas sp. TF3]RUN75948.1 aliphatic sulfonate ABC transporter substrate-binding protein [Sphingomonas sp. TF3]